ncbi:hypothetical protein [Paenibacillus sp. KS-LC4]|uniref:hypothetical protein n=1 Tax=Paenibacillus sp. KS-LC4 TaxID=2979727 RepID=UPI0030D33CFF
MNKYNFLVSIEAEQYCDEIIDEMVKLFSLSYHEALGRINRHWAGNDFDENSMLFHMLPEEWANDIYYGASSFWWNKEKKDLIPLTYCEQ